MSKKNLTPTQTAALRFIARHDGQKTANAGHGTEAPLNSLRSLNNRGLIEMRKVELAGYSHWCYFVTEAGKLALDCLYVIERKTAKKALTSAKTDDTIKKDAVETVSDSHDKERTMPTTAKKTAPAKKASKTTAKKASKKSEPKAKAPTKKASPKKAPAAKKATAKAPAKKAPVSRTQLAVLQTLAKTGKAMTRTQLSEALDGAWIGSGVMGHADPEKREEASLLAKKLVKLAANPDGENGRVQHYAITAAGRKVAKG